MAAVSEVASLLARTPLFEGVGAELCRSIAEAMREERFPPGRTIFTRSDEGSSLYLVCEGRVRLSVLSVDGRELMFRLVGPGEIMGEIAVLDAGPRTADAVTLGAVTAMSLSAARLNKLMDEQHQISQSAVRFLCRRLRETSAQLEEIALYPIERRVARFLISAMRLKGLDLQSGSVELELGMTQAEIALLLGASRPKVNVALGALEGRGAISREGDRLTCHPLVLGEIAGSDEAA